MAPVVLTVMEKDVSQSIVKIRLWPVEQRNGPIRWSHLLLVFEYCANKAFRDCWLKMPIQYIYLINQARGPYRENIGLRSWQYGSSAARSIQKRPRADILPVWSRGSLVNKRFITRLKLFKTKTKTQMIHCKDIINFKRAILKQTERLLTSEVFKKKKNKVGRKQK